jgi:hypothetical protein
MEYNILDFSGQKDDAEFRKFFKKLIDVLELYHKISSHLVDRRKGIFVIYFI